MNVKIVQMSRQLQLKNEHNSNEEKWNNVQMLWKYVEHTR